MRIEGKSTLHFHSLLPSHVFCLWHLKWRIRKVGRRANKLTRKHKKNKKKFPTEIKLKRKTSKMFIFGPKSSSSQLSIANGTRSNNNNYFNKFFTVFIVILINCIVGNLCAWQENTRPKLFVQLGEFLCFMLNFFKDEDETKYPLRRFHVKKSRKNEHLTVADFVEPTNNCIIIIF